MTDRRRLWSQGSDAEIAEFCQTHALRLVEPQAVRTVFPVTDLCDAPRGGRDRQLVLGQGFTIRAVNEEGWVFGETQNDRYSAWVECTAFHAYPEELPTHRLKAQSYVKDSPGLKTPGLVTPLSLGSELAVLSETDGWAHVAWTKSEASIGFFVPANHLDPIDLKMDDPVDVAATYTGAPYLWGGNSSFGIDCSGLVQAACVACGIACPGDSDMQMAELGVHLPEGSSYRRGDLLFWKGHVAWVVDADTILHANAHHMAVVYEPLLEAIGRIEAQGGGPVTAHKRLETTT